MKLKRTITAIVAAACFAAPAFAGANHHGVGNNNNNTTGVPVEYDDGDPGFFAAGGFVQWATVFPKTLQLQFGATIGGDDDFGLRVNPNTAHSLPANTTNTFQADWNYTVNSFDPFIVMIINDPVTGAADFWIDYVDPDNALFSHTTLVDHHGNPTGFTRLGYNGFNDGIPAGSTLNALYFGDGLFGPGSDALQNVFVNGVAVTYNTGAPTAPPNFDEVMDF